MVAKLLYHMDSEALCGVQKLLAKFYYQSVLRKHADTSIFGKILQKCSELIYSDEVVL